MRERSPTPGSRRASAEGGTGDAVEPAHVADLLADLDDLAEDVESPDSHEEIDETRDLLYLAGAQGLIDSGIRRLDARDAAEALVGSVVFASPLLVEGGIFDIAAHLVGPRVAGVPVYLLLNVCFVAVMTYALVEWTGRDRTGDHRFLGIVPSRVVMILVVSFVTTAVLTGFWGRLAGAGPAEAFARVVVLWTVGSLGAALGDIVVSDDRTAHPDPAGAASTAGASEPPAAGQDPAELVTELDDQFDEVAATLDGERERRELRRIEARATRATVDGGFGEEIRKYTSRDVAEAFVGSVFFAIPLLVEDGVFDVAAHFLAGSVAGLPAVVVLHACFVLGMIAAIVYWTGPQDVRVTRPIFGVVPRRLVGIAVVSFLTAAALMTMWGRLDGWADPVVALARIGTVWAVAAIGASLGDVLPGESSGADINDQLADLGDAIADVGDGRD